MTKNKWINESIWNGTFQIECRQIVEKKKRIYIDNDEDTVTTNKRTARNAIEKLIFMIFK